MFLQMAAYCQWPAEVDSQITSSLSEVFISHLTLTTPTSQRLRPAAPVERCPPYLCTWPCLHHHLAPMVTVQTIHQSINPKNTTNLAGDTEGMTELCLASPELTKHLRDRPGLDTTTEEGIKLLASRRQVNNIRSLLVILCRCRETHRDQLRR